MSRSVPPVQWRPVQRPILDKIVRITSDKGQDFAPTWLVPISPLFGDSTIIASKHTFFVPESVILRKLTARFSSRKNSDKPFPVICFMLRKPSTSRTTQCSAIEAHDWSVREGQLEISNSTNMFPAVWVICGLLSELSHLL